MLVRMTLLAVFVLTTGAVRADDWPQWMGPNRNNVWGETGILEKFPAGGPKVLWKAPVSGSYSGPAVANGHVYVMDYVTKDKVAEGNWNRDEISGIERVLCLDAATGKQVWKHEYAVKYSVSYPNGPRCTPLVSGGKVYTLGAEGNLHCFEAGKGTVGWQKNLKTTYSKKSPLWGYAAHPLIDGNTLYTLAGGKGSHILALNKDTGDEIWKAETSEGADDVGYCPPTILTINGVRQLVMLKPNSFTSLDPATGKRLWTQPYKADNGSIIMTPLVVGEYLYGGGYNNKNMLLKMTTTDGKPGAETVWRDKRNLGISPVNVQPFVEQGTIYGFDQGGKLFAVEIPSGKRLWETDTVVGKASNSETAFIVKNGDRFFFFTEKGDLVIGKLSTSGYEEISRANIIKPDHKVNGRVVVWSMPAFADKKIFARNDEEIVCVDLAR